ncbi:MAG: ATP synthase F1 subunit epsilon [Mariprofundus sp.]|nr:ATP synthase F1 subunit epsilon [Mariprofundus sp.]
MKCMSILIVTVEQEVYRGTASMVIVPSVDGEIAIMPGHAPLLATLRPGEVRIDCVDDKGCPCRMDDMVVFGGYVEVQPDGIIILADAIERAKDIDEARAKEAFVQSKEVLRSSDLEKASKAMLDLELAIAKLRVVRRNRKQSLMKP